MRGDGVRVRPTAVAGQFYPGAADTLAALVDALLADAPPSRQRARPVGLIAPHAGFRFSGAVAAAAYAHLSSWRGDVCGRSLSSLRTRASASPARWLPPPMLTWPRGAGRWPA